MAMEIIIIGMIFIIHLFSVLLFFLSEVLSFGPKCFRALIAVRIQNSITQNKNTFWKKKKHINMQRVWICVHRVHARNRGNQPSKQLCTTLYKQHNKVDNVNITLYIDRPMGKLMLWISLVMSVFHKWCRMKE